MKILHLTLKKKWFDMINNGQKKEEYREIKPYWEKRLDNKIFTHVLFKNGYSKNAPQCLFKIRVIAKNCYGYQKWGALENQKYYVIRLGERG